MKQGDVPKLISLGLAHAKLSLNSNYYWYKSLLVSEERDGFGGGLGDGDSCPLSLSARGRGEL